MNEMWLSGAVLFGLVAGTLLTKIAERRRRRMALFDLIMLDGCRAQVNVYGRDGEITHRYELTESQTRLFIDVIGSRVKLCVASR